MRPYKNSCNRNRKRTPRSPSEPCSLDRAPPGTVSFSLPPFELFRENCASLFFFVPRSPFYLVNYASRGRVPPSSLAGYLEKTRACGSILKTDAERVRLKPSDYEEDARNRHDYRATNNNAFFFPFSVAVHAFRFSRIQASPPLTVSTGAHTNAFTFARARARPHEARMHARARTVCSTRAQAHTLPWHRPRVFSRRPYFHGFLRSVLSFRLVAGAFSSALLACRCRAAPRRRARQCPRILAPRYTGCRLRRSLFRGHGSGETGKKMSVEFPEVT